MSFLLPSDAIKVIQPLFFHPVLRSDDLMDDESIFIYDEALGNPCQSLKTVGLVIGIKKYRKREAKFCDKRPYHFLSFPIDTDRKQFEVSTF